jgi:hypothetical protein
MDETMLETAGASFYSVTPTTPISPGLKDENGKIK